MNLFYTATLLIDYFYLDSMFLSISIQIMYEICK